MKQRFKMMIFMTLASVILFSCKKEEKVEIKKNDDAANHISFQGKKYELSWGLYSGSGNSFHIELLSPGLSLIKENNPNYGMKGFGHLISFHFTSDSEILEEGTYSHSEDSEGRFTFHSAGGALDWDAEADKHKIHFAFDSGKVTIKKKDDGNYEIKFNGPDKGENKDIIKGGFTGKLRKKY